MSLFFFCLLSHLLLSLGLLLKSFQLLYLSLFSSLMFIMPSLQLIERHVLLRLDLILRRLMELLWFSELFLLLLLMKLLLLLVVELFLGLLLVESVIHWWPFKLLLLLLFLKIILWHLFFLWPKLLMNLILSGSEFGHLSRLKLCLSIFVLYHTCFNSLSHHLFLFGLLVLALLVEDTTFCKSSFHERFLFFTVSFLCYSQSVLQIFVL